MKITALIENHAPEGLEHEHGLSLYIEYRGVPYLLDTGAHGHFVSNAAKLGIPLDSVDAVIISHNHYDHVGGLDAFFSVNSKAEIYIRQAARSKFYFKSGSVVRYIGERRGIFEEFPGRFHFVEGTVKLNEGVFLLPDGACDPRYSGQCKTLFEESEGRMELDGYLHEQSLVFEEGDGLVVFNSCSHSGIANIVRGVLDAFPGKRVSAVIGGFHMMVVGATGEDTNQMNCSPEYVKQVCDRLLELGVEKIYTGHCTGMAAYELLKKNLGERASYLQTGDVIEI